VWRGGEVCVAGARIAMCKGRETERERKRVQIMSERREEDANRGEEVPEFVIWDAALCGTASFSATLAIS